MDGLWQEALAVKHCIGVKRFVKMEIYTKYCNVKEIGNTQRSLW